MPQADQNLINDILGILSTKSEDVLDELTDQVAKIAEDALAIARSKHLYNVQTNNLASSTGFAICRNGNSVKISAFDKAAGYDGGELGTKKGKEYLQLLLGQDDSTESITLTMVAGMDYAYFVENMGLDVLRSAEDHIRQEFAELIKDYSK